MWKLSSDMSRGENVNEVIRIHFMIRDTDLTSFMLAGLLCNAEQSQSETQYYLLKVLTYTRISSSLSLAVAQVR